MADGCGLCGSLTLDVVLDMGVQPLAERMTTDAPAFPLVLLQCPACGLVQLRDVVPQEEVFPAGHPYATGNTAALRQHFAAMAFDLGQILEPDDLVVDVAANDGTLLRAYDPDVRTVAVEPTRQARKCPGAVYEEFFTAALARRIRDEHGPAQVITACNVLAHVPDAHDFAEGVAELLADDGLFVTENHDVRSVLRDLQVDTIYHEHRWYWSVATLSRLLEDHGLNVSSAKPVGTHGGSIRMMAVKAKHGFADRTYAAGVALHDLVSGLNGVVYGIGAATRASTLLQWARLEPFIACVCEVAGSEKIGSVMPGTDIPVIDEVYLTEHQPPYALLFSWHIADSLIPALREKGYRGRFIVPLPEARIVD